MSETVGDGTGEAPPPANNNVTTNTQEEQTTTAPPSGGEYPFPMEDPNSAAAAATTTTTSAEQQQQGTTTTTATDTCTTTPAVLDTANLVCRICGKGISDQQQGGGDGTTTTTHNRKRLLVRFLPVQTTLPESGLTTWDQDVCLHVFCGKTASILPTVNQPELEILSKAGVKNKHGIGPEVNAALARTRCAILVNPTEASTREKEFYLIKEFEAHLQSIRAVHAAAASTQHGEYHAQYYATSMQQHHEKQVPHKAGQSYAKPSSRRTKENTAEQHDWALHHAAAVAAATGDDLLPQQSQPQQHFESSSEEMTQDGKIRCGCGGTHLPPGTPKGAASWRSHVMTKRHQKWMEENGMLGAV